MDGWFILYFINSLNLKKKEAKVARVFAEEIVGLKWWFVESKTIINRRHHYSEGTSIRLQSLKWPERYIIIPFRPAHPSIKTIMAYEKGQIIGLELVDQPLECALETELCAYLLVKESPSDINEEI